MNHNTNLPQAATSQDMTDRYHALRGSHDPVDQVIDRASLHRQMDESNTAHRLRNRKPIVRAMGLTVGTGMLLAADAAGLKSDAEDAQDYGKGKGKAEAEPAADFQASDPGEPISVESQNAGAITPAHEEIPKTG